ncbi:MAG: class I SAM-dependent methyltransferase [Rhizobiales bacterium]|nr:class I SAM-dependent methyltransferase [Hyphomicrobiales bacterium]
MIVVSDLRPFLSKTAITGKAVDYPNPPLATLGEIAAATNLPRLPVIVPTDALGGETYLANCNGGFYSVPRANAEKLSIAWRYWALWLLDHIEPLRRVGKQQHVDQVSFWLAVQHMGLPFEPAPSNVNYYVHIEGGHRFFDPARPVALIHYHTALLDVLGRISPKPDSIPAGVDAVTRANAQISKGFNNEVFWDMRYRRFPERGSGVGSRGGNVAYKRELLKQQGIETASSVLDVGCGDLEVVKALNIKRYIGIDQSEECLRLARQARPDWEFHHGATTEIPVAQIVLCFEVLIHQETEANYHKLIGFLADKTLGSLLVSGFSADTDAIRHNGMVFFHESLASSLRRTGRFRNIQFIGKHTSVDIYRCDV